MSLKFISDEESAKMDLVSFRCVKKITFSNSSTIHFGFGGLICLCCAIIWAYEFVD